jgi:hypothetical protein
MNKKTSYIVHEYFDSLKDVKNVYNITSGYREVGPGRMGWYTECKKNVFKLNTNAKKMNYLVSYLKFRHNNR